MQEFDAMLNPGRNGSTMWILGGFAVYAKSLHIARLAYEQVRSHPMAEHFGTVELDTGETVDWVNMRWGACSRNLIQRRLRDAVSTSLYVLTNMKPQVIHSNYDPNRLLDALAERLRLEGDRELSQRLNISFKLLGKIRSGDLKISPSMLIWMAECAHTSIAELRSILGDRRIRVRLSHEIAA